MADLSISLCESVWGWSYKQSDLREWVIERMNGDEGESKARFLRGKLAGKQTHACCAVLQLLHRIVKKSTITARWWMRGEDLNKCSTMSEEAERYALLCTTLYWLYAAKWNTHIAPPHTISFYLHCPILSYCMPSSILIPSLFISSDHVTSMQYVHSAIRYSAVRCDDVVSRWLLSR